MLHQSYTRHEIHPRLPEGATEISLTSYARPRTREMLADDGERWAVLILPGGGYACTAYGEGEPVALSFLAAGVQSFVLRYSVAPDCWPQAFLETAAALAWIRNRHEEFGIRPDRIALCGFSAGGHLAGCAANLWRQEAARIENILGLEPQQVRPDRAVLCYPVISAAHDPDSGTFDRLRGNRALDPQLSLEKSVTADNPPTFLWSTWTDGSVPVRNTLLYAGALLDAGVPCETHIYGWGPHAMGNGTAESVWTPDHADPHAATWLPLCLEWLKGAEG